MSKIYVDSYINLSQSIPLQIKVSEIKIGRHVHLSE